jgi:hypothetical protein
MESTLKIYNLSYNDKERFAEIHALLGKPFGFFKSISMGGTGSPGLRLHHAPPEIMTLIAPTRDRIYCNIEIFPNGIMFRFRSRLENYGLPIRFSEIEVIRLTEQSEIPGDDLHALFEIAFQAHSDPGKSCLMFSAKTHEMPGLIKFFSRKEFEGKTSL